MKLLEINWAPTDRQLRQFGAVCLVALPLVGWIWGASTQTLGLLAGIGLLIAIVAMLFPRAVKPLFLGLMLIALPIGMVVSEIAMLLIFCLIFLPIGLLFRLMGRDALQRSIDRDAASYWQEKKPPENISQYYRQF